MKRFISLFLCFLPLISWSQTEDLDYTNLIPKKDGQFLYEEIVKEDSIKKDALFLSVKQWIVKNFKSAKSVIQMEDKDAGTIIGNGFLTFENQSFLASYEYWIYFTVEVTIKNDRYRIRVYDIIPEEHDYKKTTKPLLYTRSLDYMIACTSQGAMKKFYKKSVFEIDKNIRDVISRIKNDVRKSKSDDF